MVMRSLLVYLPLVYLLGYVLDPCNVREYYTLHYTKAVAGECFISRY
jgi:hypothetical protein